MFEFPQIVGNRFERFGDVGCIMVSRGVQGLQRQRHIVSNIVFVVVEWFRHIFLPLDASRSSFLSASLQSSGSASLLIVGLASQWIGDVASMLIFSLASL